MSPHREARSRASPVIGSGPGYRSGQEFVPVVCGARRAPARTRRRAPPPPAGRGPLRRDGCAQDGPRPPGLVSTGDPPRRMNRRRATSAAPGQYRASPARSDTDTTDGEPVHGWLPQPAACGPGSFGPGPGIVPGGKSGVGADTSSRATHWVSVGGGVQGTQVGLEPVHAETAAARRKPAPSPEPHAPSRMPRPMHWVILKCGQARPRRTASIA